MGSPGLLSLVLLGVAMVSVVGNLQMNDNSHQMVHGSIPTALSRHRRDRVNPSTFQIGNITVQRGQNWTVKFGDFMTVKRKPGGGLDVQLQPPNFLSKIFPRNGSQVPPGEVDTGVSQNFRNTRPKLISGNMN